MRNMKNTIVISVFILHFVVEDIQIEIPIIHSDP